MQVMTRFMQPICQAIACQSRKTLGSRPSGMAGCEGAGITKWMLTPESRPNAVIPAKAGIHFGGMNRIHCLQMKPGTWFTGWFDESADCQSDLNKNPRRNLLSTTKVRDAGIDGLVYLYECRSVHLFGSIRWGWFFLSHVCTKSERLCACAIHSSTTADSISTPM
jgi:hypothetical protein